MGSTTLAMLAKGEGLQAWATPTSPWMLRSTKASSMLIPPLSGEQPGGLTARLSHGIRVFDGGAVGDPRLLRFTHGPLCLLALEQIEPERDLTGYLVAGAADLAVAHAGVHVPDGEHPAPLAHREVDPGPYAVEVVIVS